MDAQPNLFENATSAPEIEKSCSTRSVNFNRAAKF
jgi:hypothetical protein